jgi:acetoin utilization protein AcuB
MAARKRALQAPPSRDMAAWPDPLPVREWMREPAVTVRADTPVREAVEIMRTRGLRHLPVMDPRDRLVGIVTDRDLRHLVFDPAVQRRLAESLAALDKMPVSQAMTWGVVTVRPTTDLREAARLMRERKIGAVPVVDGDRVVGILTETDVLAALEQLLRQRVARPRPMPSREGDRRYELGFPALSLDDPWQDNGPA